MVSTAAPRPIGWYYGWNIVAAAILSLTAADAVPLNCLSLFLQPWSAEFHVPISQILSATMPMMILMALASAVVGSLADRKPARWLLGAGLVAFAAFSFIASFATAAWQIEAVYAFLLPVPIILATSPVCNPLVARWFVKRLGLALGLTSVGVALGGILFPHTVSLLLQTVGWRVVWRISAGVAALVATPIVFLVVRDRPTEREGLDYVTPGEAAAGAVHSHGRGGGDLRTADILKRKNFWILLAVFLSIGCISIGGQYNVAPVALSRGFGQATAGQMVSLFNACNVAAVLAIGLLADRLGVRAPLVIVACAAGASGLLLGLGGGFATLAAGVALMGMSNGIWTALPAAVAVEFGAANTGRVFGLLSLILPGFSVATWGIARVKETAGSYAPILVPLGAACLIAGLIVVMFMRAPRDNAADSRSSSL